MAEMQEKPHDEFQRKPYCRCHSVCGKLKIFLQFPDIAVWVCCVAAGYGYAVQGNRKVAL